MSQTNVRIRAEALGLELDGRESIVAERLGELERSGFRFEAAGGSFELLVRRSAPDYRAPFALIDFTAIVGKQGAGASSVQVMARLRVGDVVLHTAGEADGPVQALDRAIRTALVPHYPALRDVRLVDYRVRTIDPHQGTAARARVFIESARGDERWCTVGCSVDIIEASWQALWDSLELPLLRDRDGHHPQPPARPVRAPHQAPHHSFLHLWGP